MHEDMPVYDAQGIMAAARRGRAAARALRDHSHPPESLKAPAHHAPLAEHPNAWQSAEAETEKHPADGSSYKRLFEN